jgi:aerobic carbon-monoxide dehydrogenase large subunit
MTRSLRDIAEIAYGEPSRLPPGFEAGLEAQYRYTPPPMTFTSAAHACIVEVDADTGFVKILRWISAEDCGTIINPAVVEGQIAGGLAQAIGMVLLEEVSFDERGNPTATTFKDYMLPQITDIPDFEYLHANTPSQSVGGIRGVGEGGAIIGPPTLVNAIADALAPFGEIPFDLPLTPVKLLEVIEGRSLAPRKAEETVAAPVVAAPVVAAAAPAAPAAPVSADGLWKMVLSTPMGPQEMKGRFETNGSVLSGELMSPEGAQAFSGTIEGNRILFDLKVEKPMKITLKYDIIVEGDKLTGKVKMGFFGNAKLTGERI